MFGDKGAFRKFLGLVAENECHKILPNGDLVFDEGIESLEEGHCINKSVLSSN